MTAGFIQYHGTGVVPEGRTSVTRGEPGRYLADPELVLAVNTALAVEQPLLVTGEPGTGKTSLAWSVASELGLEQLNTFFTRSDHLARDTLYHFDSLRRFYDAQTGNPDAREPERYVEYRALGQAIIEAAAGRRSVVLIDEVDKAPRYFPNDLLTEIDQMEFAVHETGRRFKGVVRPVMIVTSNSERQLPDAFLRRCVFHHITFPDAARLASILNERLSHLALPAGLSETAIVRFEEVRRIPELDKKPASGELVVWVKALHRHGIALEALRSSAVSALPLPGALLKTRDDLERLKNYRR